MVKTFIACSVKNHWLLRVGIACAVRGDVRRVGASTVRGDVRRGGAMCVLLFVAARWCKVTSGDRVMIGTAPGVLLRVVRLCIRDVFLIIRFAVGFLDCIIGGASVSFLPMLIGDFITLCLSAGVSVVITLCCGGVGDTCNSFTMSSRRCLMMRCPWGLARAAAVASVNSFVSALKCCVGVRLGS